MLDIFGYTGSFIVLISLTMNSIVKLRWINLVGAIIFCIYSYFIKAYPSVLMNFGIVIIDIYYLIKLSKSPQTQKVT